MLTAEIGSTSIGQPDSRSLVPPYSSSQSSKTNRGGTALDFNASPRLPVIKEEKKLQKSDKKNVPLKALRKIVTDDHESKVPDQLIYVRPSSNGHDSHSESKIKTSPKNEDIDMFKPNESVHFRFPSFAKDMPNF